jgi:phenylalanyl-tRNA synthetase beta chain
MRVPLTWLRTYCDPQLDAGQLATRLAMTGTEVERVERHGVGALEHFVVARVISADRHPEADRLSVCVVDAGASEPRQIVCGAPNVAAGQTVAVAGPGAVMPDGSTLKKVKLRGVESDGMILAEDELAIGTEHDGILELDGVTAPPGTPLADVLEISTDVLVLEITPNRPDCLSIYGVAREVHAATGAALRPPPWSDDPGTTGPVEEAALEVLCPELCPRFTARVFEDVRIGPSPPWLKARLMAAGQRPISNVVDITNYGMLLTGQPLHAFDLDQVAGQRLIVRRARDREEIQTLDGQLRTLDEEMVVIEDENGPTSIAGVMGGARSEVEEGTTRVLMEAANWDGPNIHRTSLRLGLRTEASGRFEKQLQPEQALEAQAVVTGLMIELCGARVVPGTIDIGGPGPTPEPIRVREDRVRGLLGVDVPRARQLEILEALEFTVSEASDGLDARPPSFRRADVTREADVIEEIARLGALDQLPATVPATDRAAEAALAQGAGLSTPGRLTPRQRLRRRAADTLVAQGLNEILGWSFTGPDLTRRLRLPEDQPELELENPMSIEHSRLRRTLIGSLLDTAQRNRAQGAARLAIFDTGAVFLARGERELPYEPYHIGALLCGPVRPPTWRDPRPGAADFFAVRGVVGGLLQALGAEWHAEPSSEPFLHPSRQAAISIDGAAVGWMGEIHPLVAAEWEIDDVAAAFELDLDAVPEPGGALYKELSSFPDVREDLAVVVREEVTAAQVVDVVRRSGGELLAGVDLFDVYRDDERVGEGNVSLALRLSFRAGDRTLTDEEVAGLRQRIVTALAEELSGSIRAS